MLLEISQYLVDLQQIILLKENGQFSVMVKYLLMARSLRRSLG